MNGCSCYCCSALCSSSGMAGNRFVYDNTEPTRQILAEEAEPVHSCRAFRGLDLFVVLYVVGVIPVTHPSFRAGTSTLTTGIIPKTSTHNNRYASYLFTLPQVVRQHIVRLWITCPVAFLLSGAIFGLAYLFVTAIDSYHPLPSSRTGSSGLSSVSGSSS